MIVVTRHGSRTLDLRLYLLLQLQLLQLLELGDGLRLVMKEMLLGVVRHTVGGNGGGPSRRLLLHGQRLGHRSGRKSRIDRGQQQRGCQQMLLLLLGGVGGLRHELRRRSVLLQLLLMMKRRRRRMTG